MSDTILGGDVTVYYLDENRQKRLEWSGAASDTQDIADVYDALMDLFDEQLQMDDGSPMDYDTPTEFKIGNIDQGATEPWFVDRETVEHFTGASLKSVGWLRVEGTGTNVGIVKMGYSQTVALVPGDIGLDVLMTTDGDRGTLLDYNDTTNEMWIRPDDSTSGNSFDNSPTADGAWTIVTGTGTGTQSGGAAISGESIWGNFATLGTVDGLADTHFYAEQDGSKVVAYKGTDDWWGDGHISPVIPVQVMGVLIDEGVMKWHGRQFTKTYAYFEVTDTTGKQNPIPLSAGDDTENEDGYAQTVMTDAANGPFLVGEVIGNNVSRASATKLGVVTSVSGTEPNVTLQYYLIGDLTAFVNSDVLEGYTSSADGTVVTPTSVNAATYTDISYTFTATTADVDQDDTDENYAIAIDLNSRSLDEMHARNQYLCRRGETATLDGIEGQLYIGLEWKFNYASLTGAVAEGSTVTQVSSGATGVVVSHDTVNDLVSLRTTRGTFVTDQNIELDGSNRFNQPLTNLVQIAPKGATTGTPFGNKAGASFFGADGVLLSNVASADANNYTLKDLDGNLVAEQLSVSLGVTNTRAGDRVAVWRLSSAGGPIQKDEFTIDATQGGVNSTSIVADASIGSSVVGKSTGGVIFVLDNASGYSERYRYTSWSADTFTLFVTTQSAATGGSQTSLIDSGANFVTDNVEVGDIVYNVTEGTYAYVTNVATTTLTMSNEGSENPVTDWNGDTYHVGATAKAYAVTDNAYVPFIHVLEDTGTDGSPGSETASVIYSTDIPVRVVVRQKGDIKPFSTPSTIEVTGASVPVTRNDDAVAT